MVCLHTIYINLLHRCMLCSRLSLPSTDSVKLFFVGGGRWGGKVVCRLCCVYPVALSWKVGILKVIYLLLTETGHDPSYRFNRNSHDPGLLFCVILYVCIMTMYYVPKMCSVAV